MADPPRRTPEEASATPAATGEAGGAQGIGASPRARRRGKRGAGGTMIPARAGRTFLETFVMRLVATAGIIGIGVAIGAIMQSQHSRGWLIGLVVSGVSVILAAILWSARRL